MDEKVLTPGIAEMVFLAGIAVILLTLSGTLFAYRKVRRLLSGQNGAGTNLINVIN